MESGSLVLGLGNLHVGDEGFGIHAIQRLRDRYTFRPPVELVDGGTRGLTLLPILQDAERIIVLDAVDVQKEPGTLVRLGWDDLKRVLQVKISPHQETVVEALAALELTRGPPKAFRALSVQPAVLEPRVELSPRVDRAVETAILDTLEILTAWGHVAQPKVAA